MIKTLTIVGVGLIGGSIGLAAKSRGIAQCVLGAGRSADRLEQARVTGAIDEGLLDIEEAVRRAEVAVFCTPVDLIGEQVLAAAPACAPGTLLTDAGSTKADLVRCIEGRLPRGVDFVGSHPLAGSEKRGSENADGDLFQDRLTVVTKTAQTAPAAVKRTAAFWHAIGSRVHVMDPEAHDRALAVTSHLPHLVASALAAMLPRDLFLLTATGFRDCTRIAAGDPSIWTGIFTQNRAAVMDALDQLLFELNRCRALLDAGDWDTLAALLARGKEVRDALGS